MDLRRIQGNTLFHFIIFVILSICVFTEQFVGFDTTTPKPNFNTDCTNNGLLLIKGDVISIAEVIKTVKCWPEVNQINIFALNKVIFDGDIDKRNFSRVNVAIFAPTWEITPPPLLSSKENRTERRIRLNADYEFNFYGVCIEKINGERLQFGVDGDESRIKLMFNNNRSIDELSKLKPTAIFISSFNEVEILKDYRHYARANFEQSTNHSKLWEFLVELSTQYGLINLNELIDDFMHLENKYFDLKKHIDVMSMYQSLRDQFELFNQQLEGSESLRNIFHAALISKILASRNHTTITEIEQLNGHHYLNDTLNRPSTNLLDDHEKILNSHAKALERSIQWANELNAINTALVDDIYSQSARNDDDDDDDAIIRNQIEFPLKSIQLLLSTIAKDANVPVQEKKHSLLLKFFGKFQYNLFQFKEGLQDFEDILKQDSAGNGEIHRTIADLLVEVNELLVQSDQNRNENLLNVLFNTWPKLSNVIHDTKSHLESQNNQNRNYNVVRAIDQLNRMQSLMKCSHMGIETYRDCNNGPRKMVSFVQRYDSTFKKHRVLLEKWKEFEHDMYGVIVNLFRQTGSSHILPHLYELNRIFGKMQHHSFNYSSDIKRAIQDTNQAIKLTIDMYNANQAVDDRQIFINKLKSRSNEPIDRETQSKMDIFHEIIKSNLMLEHCLTVALQTLKMRFFPFDQERLILCDLPANANATWNSTNVMAILKSNIKKIESGRDVYKPYYRQIDEDNIVFPNSTYSLYEWKYKDFKNEIHRLLSGESVMLNADIANSLSTNGVKFNKLWLKFNSANETGENRFKNATRGHRIRLEMIGNHYYRCENRYFYVPGINVGPIFKYHTDIDAGNGMYHKIQRTESFFSPHTIWRIKLIKNRSGYANPKELIGEEINLELFGRIYYVGDDFFETIPMMCTNDEINRNYFLDRIDDGLPTRWSRENQSYYSVS